MGNFNTVAYLKKVRELQEAQYVYMETIKRIEEEINKLGYYKTFKEPKEREAPVSQARVNFGKFLSILILPISFVIWWLVGAGNDEANAGTTWFKIYSFINFNLTIFIAMFIQGWFSLPTDKASKMVRDEYNAEVDKFNELLRQDAARVEKELNVKKPELERKIQFYRAKLQNIEQALDRLYSLNIVDVRYRNLRAAIMFHEYMDSGRCDTMKECMNKFDDDMEFLRIHERIDALHCSIFDLERSISGRLSGLASTLKQSSSKSYELLSTSLAQQSQQLDRLEYNMYVDRLCLLNMRP